MYRITQLFIVALCGTSLAFTQGTSVGTASAIAVNGNASATISTSSSEHYWKITTAADGYLRVEINSGSGIDVDATLFDQNGTSSILFDGRSGTYTELFGFLKPGTYYIRANLWSGTSGSYTVSSTFASPSLSADAEQNDTFANAISLSPTGTATGHLGFYGNGSTDTEDYWKITTTEDGYLRVTVTADSLDLRGDVSLDFDLALYDIDGTTSISSDGGYGTVSRVWNFVRPGTYYIRSYRWGGRAGSYEIHAEFTPPPLANDTEPNDAFSNALTLTMNQLSSGHIGYYTNNSTDTEDWWKYSAASADSFYVHIVSDDALDLDLTAYASDGATVITGDGGYGILSQVGIKPTAGAMYYFRVYRWSGTAGSYSVIVQPPLLVGVESGEGSSGVPREPFLDQNFPNPFNPSTTIRFGLSQESNVRLVVYSLLGQEVVNLLDEKKPAGFYTAVWNGSNSQGVHVPSGLYLLRLQYGNSQFVKKVMLVR